MPNIPDGETKGKFLIHLLNEVLPVISPQLFPHTENILWDDRATYALPEILDLQREIGVIQQESQNKIDRLNQEIEFVREKHAYLYDLIRKQGDELVVAVKQALEVLGFTKVIDVDNLV